LSLVVSHFSAQFNYVHMDMTSALQFFCDISVVVLGKLKQSFLLLHHVFKFIQKSRIW